MTHYPYSARVIKGGTLKTAASHTSPGAIDLRHRKVVTRKGMEVSVRGPVVVSDAEWSPVELSAPDQFIHGFLLATSVSGPPE